MSSMGWTILRRRRAGNGREYREGLRWEWQTDGWVCYIEVDGRWYLHPRKMPGYDPTTGTYRGSNFKREAADG